MQGGLGRVSCLGWVSPWHPCGTRDTLSRRLPALYTKAMWHPCTLNLEISRVREIIMHKPFIRLFAIDCSTDL